MTLSDIGRDRLREGARTSLQSAVAAGLAWVLIDWLWPPHASWAVITAIYVVSQSAGGTLKAALGRAVGTVAGTILGLLSVLLIGGAALTPTCRAGRTGG